MPPQSGHTPSRRKRLTRAKPFSSFTLDSAFSTVYTALKYVKVELREVVALLGPVQDVLLHRGAMEHDVALLGRELAERRVRAHAHGAADLLHKIPHERAPRQHRAVVDADGLVGHERRLVHRAHDARAAAGGAGARRC